MDKVISEERYKFLVESEQKLNCLESVMDPKDLSWYYNAPSGFNPDYSEVYAARGVNS